MTIEDKIRLIEEHDNTTIAASGNGYIISTDEEEFTVDIIELESWIDYQLESDPGFYGLTLSDYYHGIGKKNFKVFDAISLEDYTARQFTETDNYNPLDGDWRTIKVDAIEHCGNMDKVYIAM